MKVSDEEKRALTARIAELTAESDEAGSTERALVAQVCMA
jgi:hypothetical protein